MFDFIKGSGASAFETAARFSLESSLSAPAIPRSAKKGIEDSRRDFGFLQEVKPRDKSVGDVSGNAREFPSNKFVMDPSPGAIRVSCSLEFIVGSFLEELPSDVNLVLVGRKKSMEGLEPRDTKGIATFLIPDDVLGKRVLVPGFPKVSGASRTSKEGGDLGRPSFCLVVFKVGNSQGGSSSSEIDASEFEVKMEPTFEVEEVFGSNPLTRTRSKEAVSSGFSGKNLGGGRDELPEKAQDREAEDVVKSTFVFEANIELAVTASSD